MAPERGPTYAPALGTGGAKTQGLGVVKVNVRGQGLSDVEEQPSAADKPREVGL